MAVFEMKKDWRGRTKFYCFGRKILSLPTGATEAGKIYKEFLSGKDVTTAEQIIVLKAMFAENAGYPLNIENPQTFNEKIQWMKLYYHDPLMSLCADKYRVLDYVKECIGEEYLIPMFGAWDSVDEIDFDALPQQFVLKVNWGCGQNIIVKDKSKLNIINTKRKLKKWMNPQYNNYYSGFEWVYKNIQPKIICEQYLEQKDGDLHDYKVFCFHGEPYCFWVDIDRYNDHRRNFYDLQWSKMEISFRYPQSSSEIEKIKNIEEVLDCTRKLAHSFPHVRVDFYLLNDKLYFGELTFSTSSGMGRFTPQEVDLHFGDLINLERCKQSPHYVA